MLNPYKMITLPLGDRAHNEEQLQGALPPSTLRRKAVATSSSYFHVL